MFSQYFRVFDALEHNEMPISFTGANAIATVTATATENTYSNVPAAHNYYFHSITFVDYHRLLVYLFMHIIIMSGNHSDITQPRYVQ